MDVNLENPEPFPGRLEKKRSRPYSTSKTFNLSQSVTTLKDTKWGIRETFRKPRFIILIYLIT